MIVPSTTIQTGLFEDTSLGAAGVNDSIPSCLDDRRGSNPTAALHALHIHPLPMSITKQVLEYNHYLHSLPGSTKLTFGIFNSNKLAGSLALGVGPNNAHSLVEGATPDDCLTLTRLWLSDELPPNSESRVISLVTRSLRKHTSVKFILTYADPSWNHVGIIYQASGWLYTGLSSAMPLYDLGDGIPRHSRSVAQVFGTHSIDYFTKNGVTVKLVSQEPKHRYLYFLNNEWRSRLRVPVLPYPKKEACHEHN
jgi:hypothetical protein